MDETTKRRGRGRPATGQKANLVTRVDAETSAAIGSLLAPDERPSDFVRAAIEREIARRRRKVSRKAAGAPENYFPVVRSFLGRPCA
jgi:hypothetical protein